MSTPSPGRRTRRKKKRAAHTPGLPPGTLVIPPDAPPPVVHAIGYGPERFEEYAVESAADLAALRGRWPVLWVNVNGIGDAAELEKLGEVFKLHPLALEDVVNTNQRPKVEAYDGALFVILRTIHVGASPLAPEVEQLALFVGRDFVLSIQEHPGDPFDPVRGRIRQGRKMIRSSGPDYLGYALIDAVIDHFFPLMAAYGDVLEELEAAVMDHPARSTLASIRAGRRALITVRRTVWPLRDVAHKLQGDGLPFIQPETHIYMRDLFDHVLRIIDLAESYRDQVSGLMEGYMTSVSFRMNEVMGVLTLVGTVFLPLSFLTGMYGMNFDTSHPWNLPELSLPFGYPLLLACMGTLVIAMFLYFRRRGWLQSSSIDD